MEAAEEPEGQTVVQPVQGAAPPATVGAGAVGSVTHSPPTVAQPHMTLVSSPLPVGQSSLTLPPSTPQPVFLSHGVPLNQAANPPVLPLSQPVGPVNKSVGTSVLPISQTIRPGVLPLSQPVGPISRPVGPGVLSVNRPVGSGVLPVNPSVTPGVLQAVSPGAQRKRCRDPRCSPGGNPACRGTFGGGGFLPRHDEDLREPLVRRQGSQVERLKAGGEGDDRG